jgi:hypothetical protein
LLGAGGVVLSDGCPHQGSNLGPGDSRWDRGSGELDRGGVLTYGSPSTKQVYIYGGLDTGPITGFPSTARPSHTRKVAGSKPAGTTTESPVQRWFSPGVVLIAPSRFKIIRPISGQTFRLDPVDDYGRSPRASSAEAMLSSSSSAPDRRQIMPNVTIWKRCGAAWRVVDVSC